MERRSSPAATATIVAMATVAARLIWSKARSCCLPEPHREPRQAVRIIAAMGVFTCVSINTAPGSQTRQPPTEESHRSLEERAKRLALTGETKLPSGGQTALQ